MIGKTNAIATVGVKNLDAAKRFYEQMLGLEPAEPHDEPGTRTYKTGASTLLVYESSFAGTNQATAVTWALGEGLEQAVQGLKSKGVVFEHYDMPETTRKGDIHVAGDIAVAWFKDPDGNIHALVNG